MNRREFILATGAAACAPISAWGDAMERPLVTVGWMTDTHVKTSRESCALVEKAYRLFKSKHVDVIINNGDIADHYYPEGYRHYRAVADEVYADVAKKPLELSIFAWHDAYEWDGPKVRETTPEGRTACYSEVKRLLRIPHERMSKHVINGVSFLTIDQWHEGGDIEQLMTETERESNGLPIFVIDHVPPMATTQNSLRWGQIWSRVKYDRHPQCIVLTGHTHGSLRDENNIYQDNITVVNCACLQRWQGWLAGNSGSGKNAYGVMVFEVYANRVVFRRYDVRDGSEYRAENPWIVPYPLDRAAAPYALARRRAASMRPEFAPDAKLTLSSHGKTHRLSIPRVAKGEGDAYKYRVVVQEFRFGRWQIYRDFEVFTEFYLRECERHATVTEQLPEGMLRSDGKYRLEVSPLNWFGVAGDALKLTV